MSKKKILLLLLFLAGVSAYFKFQGQIGEKNIPPEQVEESSFVKSNDGSALFPIDFDSEAGIQNSKHHSFKGETLYQIHRDPEGDFLEAKSEKTSSALFKEIELEMGLAPKLKWHWKVITFPAGKKHASLADRSENDFAARVYAIFEGANRFKRDVIQYVWDDAFPEGASADNSALNQVKILVLRSGQPGQAAWVQEERDLAKDYETLFGKTPRGKLVGLGFMSDSDNLQSSSAAGLKNMSLVLDQQKAALVKKLNRPASKSFFGKTKQKIQDFTIGFVKKIPKPWFSQQNKR